MRVSDRHVRFVRELFRLAIFRDPAAAHDPWLPTAAHVSISAKRRQDVLMAKILPPRL